MNISTTSKLSSFIHYTTYSMIVAVDEAGGIGIDNKLPWPKCKEDMQWFRSQTLGKIIVMGRKTFESIGSKPLPGRINIVIGSKLEPEVARTFNKENEGNKDAGYLMFVPSVSKAKEMISMTAGTLHNGGEVMVIGGASIYEAFWNDIGRVYLTTFKDTFNTDVKIHMNLNQFELVYRDDRSVLGPKFEIYDAQQTFRIERKDTSRFA